MKKLISISLALVCFSCVVPKIDLSEEEEEAQNKLKKDLKCETIELRHDYKAIKENRLDGEFTISLCDGLCKEDSINLVPKTIEWARSIKRLLSHPQNYSHIIFYTSVEKKISERTSNLICDKKIKLSIRDLKVVEFKNH